MNQRSNPPSRINSNMNRKKTQSSIMNKSFKTSNMNNDNFSSSSHHHKLTYKDIEMWATKYDLSWKEIFELDSEF